MHIPKRVKFKRQLHTRYDISQCYQLYGLTYSMNSVSNSTDFIVEMEPEQSATKNQCFQLFLD